MLSRNIAALWLIAAALILMACGATTPAPPTSRQTQTVDGLTISLEAADRPAINQAERFVIALSDANGQPISDASVYLDLDMPAMPMGSNQPIADAQGDGTYRAETAYTMTGTWEISVIVKWQGKEYRARFEREVGS